MLRGERKKTEDRDKARRVQRVDEGAVEVSLLFCFSLSLFSLASLCLPFLLFMEEREHRVRDMDSQMVEG